MSAKDLPKDLLDQAAHLASREKKRPKQASLRRAVSAAYYALFHLLTSEATLTIAPNVTAATRFKMQRWFDHREMRKICGHFASANLKEPLKAIIGSSASADLQLVAKTFISLQESRHQADYDLGKNYSRLAVLSDVQQARYAFEAWARIRKTSEANVFVISLLMWANWEKRQ